MTYGIVKGGALNNPVGIDTPHAPCPRLPLPTLRRSGICKQMLRKWGLKSDIVKKAPEVAHRLKSL